MTLLKDMFLVCAMFLLCINIVFSQSSFSNLSEEEKIEFKENMEELVDELQLSEEQKPEFISISKKYGVQLLELKGSDASRMSKYRKMKSITKSRNREMKDLLSGAQYDIYLDKQKQMQKKMASRN